MVAVVLAVLALATSHAADPSGRKAILVLNSYHLGFTWTDSQVEGIVSALRESELNPEVFVEHLDVLRQPAPYDDGAFAEYLGRRHRSRRFDLVMAADDAALSFIVRHHASLFAGTPVVFSDAAAFDPGKIGPEIAIMGVLERIDVPSTVQAARRLRPRARQIVVFANRADAGSGPGHAREVLSTLKTDIPIRINDDLTLEEIAASTAALSPEDIVFVLASAHDSRGAWHSHSEVIERVGPASPAPLFDITSHRVRRGLTLGGKVEDGAEVGRAAAQMAVRILRGEDPRSIPVEHAPVGYLFSYAQMQRHGIEESALPEGSEVVGKPPTLYDQYRAAVWATAAVVLPLTLAVVVLSANTARRKRAEETLRRNEERLRLALVAGKLGFYDLDLKTGEALVSAEYASMLGDEAGETTLSAAE